MIKIWLRSKWQALCRLMLDSIMCHKEQMGYTCHHRVMSNGRKECE